MGRAIKDERGVFRDTKRREERKLKEYKIKRSKNLELSLKRPYSTLKDRPFLKTKGAFFLMFFLFFSVLYSFYLITTKWNSILFNLLAR